MNENKTNFRTMSGQTGRLAAIAVLMLSAVSYVRAQGQQTLTMKEVVTLALQNSRDLALARIQYNIALNQTAVERGDFHPNLYTGSGAAYTNGSPFVPGGGLPSLFSLSYTQTLFNLPLKGQIKAAEDRAASQKLEIDRIRDDVIVRAATAYLELAKVQHSIALRRDDQASAAKILDVTRDRVSASQELPIEITRGELAAARAREELIKLEDRAEILAQQIRDLTSIPDNQPITVGAEEPDFSTPQAGADLLSLAFQNDQGLLEAANERKAREDLLKGARGEHWPTISLVGEYQVLEESNNFRQYFPPTAPFQRNVLAIGAQISIPIFSAKTRANIALARSQLNAAELTLSTKRQQVSLEVQQKSRAERELDAAREVARLDLQLAQENVQLLQAKFDQGGVTLRDMEQARLDENDKWVAFLDANFARQQGQLSLLQATGQLAKVFQ
jgi:outer membrane protein TolC